MTKYFALSDIHGRGLTMEMFEREGFDINNEDHTIILLGDYFDRGKKNLEVYEFCLTQKECLGDRLILLKGNHDEMLEDFLTSLINLTTVEDGIEYDKFLYNHLVENGGKVTLNQLVNKGLHQYQSYHPAIIKRARALLKFLQSLEYQHFDDERALLFTHAGSEKGMVSLWTRTEIYKDEERDYNTIIGHTPFEIALAGDVETGLNELDLFILNASGRQQAVCNRVINNGVYLIDNGYGDNIVVI